MSDGDLIAQLEEQLAEAEARTEVSERQLEVFRKVSSMFGFHAEGEATLGLGDDVDTTDEEEAA